MRRTLKIVSPEDLKKMEQNEHGEIVFENVDVNFEKALSLSRKGTVQAVEFDEDGDFKIVGDSYTYAKEMIMDMPVEIGMICVLEEDESLEKGALRYVLTGTYLDGKENGVTGIVYDYSGGGNWEETFVVGGELIHSLELSPKDFGYDENFEDEEGYLDTTLLEWDDLVDIFGRIIGNDLYDKLKEFRDEYMDYTEDDGYYLVCKYDLLEEGKENIQFKIGAEIEPVEYCNTIWGEV